MPPSAPRTIEAAGVVLLDGHRRVAVVHRPHRSDWSLPKGKLEGDEHPALAAVRECFEETGVTAVLGPRLSDRRYEVDGLPKRVRSWRAAVRDQPEFSPNDEVDELRWVPVEEAADVLSYEGDVSLVAQATALPDTTALVVVRHAEAVKRSAWRDSGEEGADDDGARPLTPSGLVQSDHVALLLQAYGVTAGVTSDARRCRQTLEPYAALGGVVLDAHHELSEEGFISDPEATERLVGRLLLDPRPAAWCTHRPVLPIVLRHVAHQVGADPHHDDLWTRACTRRGSWSSTARPTVPPSPPSATTPERTRSTTLRCTAGGCRPLVRTGPDRGLSDALPTPVVHPTVVGGAVRGRRTVTDP